MESTILLMKAFSVLFFLLLVLDYLVGDSWINVGKRLFGKSAEIMLQGAILEVYHKKIDSILRVADSRVGFFIPKLSVFLGVIFTFSAIFLLGGVVQSIQEGKALVPDFFESLLAFSVSSTIAAAFCYSTTYMVLYLIQVGSGQFVLRYVYLLGLEVLVSYFLAPLAYASLFFFEDRVLEGVTMIESRIRVFGMVLATWPYSVVRVSLGYVYNFQSAVNATLLWISMILCVLPTFLHVMLLVVDICRYILRNICESLMNAFDRLSREPIRIRGVLWGIISAFNSIAWLIG